MTVLGTVAHQICREAGRSTNLDFDPERRWDEVVEAINKELRLSWVESGLYPLQSSAPMYQVLKKRTCSRAKEIGLSRRGRSAATNRGQRDTGYELPVESWDKTVVGSIDRVEKLEGGIVLSDLKTGAVANAKGRSKDSSLKEDYSLQLKLYAALYHQTFGIWPSRLRIVPLSGAEKELHFTQSECMGLLADATLTLKLLNEKIREGVPTDLATPSPSACRFCTFRPVCKAYQQQSSKASQAWPPDIFGKVWDINMLQNGAMNLRVITNRGNQVTLRSLSPQRHPALKCIQRGDQVGVFNARTAAARQEFTEGPLTILYKYEHSFFTTERQTIAGSSETERQRDC